MSALKAIQVGRRQLGLEDGDYRAILLRVTGKQSAGDMNETERQRVLGEFRRLGFGFGAGEQKIEGPFAAKVVALWLSAWNLGLVRNKSGAALIAFVTRQTGIDHLRWVREPEDARKVIEALKAWITRGAGVAWPQRGDARSNKLAVVSAQIARLGCKSPEGLDRYHDGDLDRLIKELGRSVRGMEGGA